MSLSLPSSYAALPYTQIRLHHHPASSPTPTPVIVLELYRPKNANAFTAKMLEELLAAYCLFDADDRVKAIVVTGHGKVFCAGADLNQGFQQSIAGRKTNEHRDGQAVHSPESLYTHTDLTSSTAAAALPWPSTTAASRRSARSTGLRWAWG